MTAALILDAVCVEPRFHRVVVVILDALHRLLLLALFVGVTAQLLDFLAVEGDGFGVEISLWVVCHSRESCTILAERVEWMPREFLVITVARQEWMDVKFGLLVESSIGKLLVTKDDA